MVRPELALLGAHAKMEITSRFLRLDERTLPSLEQDLISYFPTDIVELLSGTSGGSPAGPGDLDYGAGQPNHRSRGSYVFLRDGARDRCSVRPDRSRLSSCRRVVPLLRNEASCARVGREIESAVQYRALLAIEESSRTGHRLDPNRKDRLERISAERDRYRELLGEYEAQLPEGLTKHERTRFKKDVSAYHDSGFGADLSARMGCYGYWTAGLGIAHLAKRTGFAVSGLARLYYSTAEHSQILPLVRSATRRVSAAAGTLSPFGIVRTRFWTPLPVDRQPSRSHR